ncbi:MAG: 23S rRNA (guanosine(2251)-2'-O)-methyltransferase RlmB [Eggerthellaceae bacterium]|jgi:23S rRNA (guanosine2251-2'-O)-methyltransferase
MAEYIEGKHPVIEALRTDTPISEVLIADNAKRDGLIADIMRKAKQRSVPVKMVPRKELEKHSARGSHQGVMAKARPYDYASLGQIIQAADVDAAQRGGSALVVLLDHITDAGNLGAIARSAEVVGASGIVIPNRRSAQVQTATYKSSAGAIANLHIAQVANLGQAIDRLKEEGFWIAGASEHAQDSIWKANLKGKIGLVMGNENEGLSRLTREKCDFLVALPQVGTTQSLNVAQASTAAMYEWLRQNWHESDND